MVSMLLRVALVVSTVVASEGCTVGSAECGTEMDCQSVNGVGKCVLKPQPAQPSHQGCTVGSAECGTEMDCQSVDGIGKCMPLAVHSRDGVHLGPYFPETDAQTRKQHAGLDPEEVREFFPEMEAEMRRDYDWRQTLQTEDSDEPAPVILTV